MSIGSSFLDVIKNYPNAELINEGGQKIVYLITDKKYGKCVLKLGLYQSDSSLERISREVTTLQKINSPYYPKNFEFQVLDSKRFLILEEYIPSEPLSSRILDYQNPSSALRVIYEISCGLSVIWKMRIVHRDVKPANILVTNDGKIRIIDLGIARLLDEDSLTRSGTFFGPATKAYAAPE